MWKISSHWRPNENTKKMYTIESQRIDSWLNLFLWLSLSRSVPNHQLIFEPKLPLIKQRHNHTNDTWKKLWGNGKKCNFYWNNINNLLFSLNRTIKTISFGNFAYRLHCLRWSILLISAAREEKIFGIDCDTYLTCTRHFPFLFNINSVTMHAVHFSHASKTSYLVIIDHIFHSQSLSFTLSQIHRYTLLFDEFHIAMTLKNTKKSQFFFCWIL